MSSTSKTQTSFTPEEIEDRLLIDRIRLAGRIVIAGIVVVLVGALVRWAGERPRMSLVQIANIVAVALMLRFLRPPSHRRENLVLAFLGYAVTAVSVGIVGVMANDATTPVILLVAMAVGVATLLPWGPRWQLGAVVVAVAVATWTVATLVELPRLFWVQNIGSVLPTLIATILIAHVVSRERSLIVRTEHEHEAREARLREVNRNLAREISDHRRTEDVLRFTLRELDHRVKNTLATVQSVAQHTLDSSASLDDFGRAFHGRLQAMARIHAALAARKWEGLAFGELVELVVGPLRRHPESVAIDSKDGFVTTDLARVLGMALHELATNAAKYGALSTGEGRVIVSSRLDPNGGPRLRIQWRESNGPAVDRPPRRGLGMKLIEEALAYESGGEVSLRFEPSGLCCEFDIPLPEQGFEGA